MTLRPRGLLEVSEFDFRVYDVHRQPIMPSRLDEDTPWLARWMNLVNIAVEQRGGEPDAANHLRQWASEHPHLEDIVYREFWFQTGPWRHGHDLQTARDNRTGAMMRDDILVRFKYQEDARYASNLYGQAFLKSGRPLLLSNDVDVSVVDELESNAERELLEASAETYIRVQNVWARRIV